VILYGFNVLLELLDTQNNPLVNLMPIRDYRGVPPIVYFIFLELYGKDSSPELCRYQIDIYKPPVSVAKLVNIQLTGRVSEHDCCARTLIDVLLTTPVYNDHTVL